MISPEAEGPTDPGIPEHPVPEPDMPYELTARRAQRFIREDNPPRYACSGCGAHALFRGLCMVCCSDMTYPIDEYGRSVQG